MFLFRSQIHPIENKQNWFSKLPYAMKIMVHQLLDWLLRLTIASLSFAIDDGFPKRICGGKNQKQIFPILVVKPHLKKVRSLLGFTCFHFSPRHLPIQTATDKSKMWTSHTRGGVTNRPGRTTQTKNIGENEEILQTSRLTLLYFLR